MAIEEQNSGQVDNTTKKPKMLNTKKVAKNSGEMGGAALGIILVKLAEHFGVQLTDTEAVILGGFLVSVGTSIRLLFQDEK